MLRVIQIKGLSLRVTARRERDSDRAYRVPLNHGTSIARGVVRLPRHDYQSDDDDHPDRLVASGVMPTPLTCCGRPSDSVAWPSIDEDIGVAELAETLRQIGDDRRVDVEIARRVDAVPVVE